MAVITISRQFGAGGRTLGERLAKSLGYRYVHEDMIKEVALRAKVTTRKILDFERRGTTKLTKFLDKIVKTDYVDRLISSDYGYVDEKGYVDAINTVVEEIYSEGNAVIIGRGSQFILKGRENTLHLLLVANLAYRVRFLADKYKLKENEAQKAIERADIIRSRYLSFHAPPEEHENPLNYDLAINVERVGMDEVEQMVVHLISEKGK
jgi:cytidylate kinase